MNIVSPNQVALSKDKDRFLNILHHGNQLRRKIAHAVKRLNEAMEKSW